MTELTNRQIADAINATYEVDESGDATIMEYMADQGYHTEMTVREFFLGFLIWANGEDWLTSDKEDNIRIRKLANID